jgi:hypothetical protein
MYAANPYAIPTTPTSSDKSSKKDSGLISDDLLKKLDGIPVDVDNLMESIADIEHKQSMGMPVSSRTVRRVEAQINRVVQQSKYLKEAEERAEKNDAFGEIAVGNRGELFTVSEDGDIKTVSIRDYNAEKHGPALTVNELIE